MTKPVVVLLCDDEIAGLHYAAKDIRRQFGGSIEVATASTYLQIRGALEKLVAKGLFPSVISIDNQFHEDHRQIFRHLKEVHEQATAAGLIDTPFPERAFIHSGYYPEAQTACIELWDDAPFKLEPLPAYDMELSIPAIVAQWFPGLKHTEPVTQPPSPSAVTHSHLSDYYTRLAPVLQEEAFSQAGPTVTATSGFGNPVGGYVVFDERGVSDVETWRSSVSSLDEQQIVLAVEKFDDEQHGPLLHRIGGMIIAEPDFDPHIPNLLQTYGVSALIGCDYALLAQTFLKSDVAHEAAPCMLLPHAKTAIMARSVYEDGTPESTGRWLDLIQRHLAVHVPLSPVIKVQASDSIQMFNVRAGEGIGLIRSENFIRGSRRNFNAAKGILLGSAGDEDAAKVWRDTQQAAFSLYLCDLHEKLGEAHICIRLADFGQAAFLAKDREALQSACQAVELPQGVQLARLRPDIYSLQLQGFFNAAAEKPPGMLEILIPQVMKADDVSFVRKMAKEAAASVGYSGAFKLGSMIETRAALSRIAAISKRSDFLSIGMNDLVRESQPVRRQWTDRQDAKERIGGDPYLQPPVFLLDAVTAGVAKVQGQDTRLCGDFASTAEGMYFAHKAGIGSVVMLPDYKLQRANAAIAREVLWRESKGEIGLIEQRSDPVLALAYELKLAS